MIQNSKAIALPASLLLAVALIGGCETQRTFNSPEEAVNALNNALMVQNKTELRKLFGPEVDQLKSGDPEQDHDDAVLFSRRFKAAHKIEHDGPDYATLLVGEDEWPFAVPLVLKESKWSFDTEAGLDELTSRRIGRNERLTIAACRTLIDAQAEFFERDPDEIGVKHYAKRLLSSEGKKDGLYWPAPGGVDPSPIGPVMAKAAKRDEKGERAPFHGYFFKPLASQGASATGGAMDYAENGNLTRGWAILAYPAVYGQTGIKSFICSNNGIVYEQDFGDETPKAIEAINAFDPGTDWEKIVTPAALQ